MKKKHLQISWVQIFSVLITCLITDACTNNNNQQASAVDSISVDTSSIDTSFVYDEKTDTYIKPERKEILPSIKVDSSDLSKLLANSRKTKDEFGSSVFYHDRTSPKFVNYNGFFIYVGYADKAPYLRFCMQYVADDWLFIKRVKINIDGKNFDLYPEEFKRDNGDGEIWEWSDDAVDAETINILEKIANSKTTKVKFDGSDYYKIKEVTASQKKAIKNMLKLYKALYLYGK